MVMVSGHRLAWSGQEGRECVPHLLRFTLLGSKSSGILRFLQVSTKLLPHVNTKSVPPLYSSNALSFIVHFSNQKSTNLKPMSSDYPLSFSLLITPQSHLLLSKDFTSDDTGCSLALSPSLLHYKTMVPISLTLW